MDSALFSPTTTPESEDARRQRRHALAALSEWQEAYLGDETQRSAFWRASSIPPEHMLKDTQLARAVADGARYLGGPCSHGVDLPTHTQDRYEYMVLAKYVEEFRQASERESVDVPAGVLFGSLPIGHPTAQVVRPARSDEYLVVFNSGLFGYLYTLGRIVASCFPYEQAEDGFTYSLDPAAITAFLASPGAEPSRYIGPADAAERLEALLRACVCQGSPWAMPPTRVRRMLIPLAESLVDASHAFVVAHEFAHVMRGHLDRPHATRHALGPSDAAEFLDYAWQDEMEADFLGTQAALAACAARERPTVASYAGMDLYLHGVEILYEAIATMAGRQAAELEGLLWPTLRRRRSALRSGIDFYLAGVDDVRQREHAFADAARCILETLWAACRDSLAAGGPDAEAIAPLWQPTLSHAASPQTEPEPPGVGPAAYDLLAATSPAERLLLAELAPAVAVTLFHDTASDDAAARARAAEELVALDSEFRAHLPLISLAMSRRHPEAGIGDDEDLAGMLGYAAACIEDRARVAHP